MKNTLGDEVETVKASERLKNYPVCLSSQGDISLEMEKVLSSQPNFNDVKAKRVLEVNVAHDVFKKLNDLWTAGDKEKLADYTKLLYDQSLLIAGLDVKDPAEFSSLICKLM